MSRLEASEHRLRRRIGERHDAGLEAGLLEGSDEAVVVGGGEFAREQEQGFVLEARGEIGSVPASRCWNHCIPATMERAVGLQADGGLAAHVAVSPKTLHALPDEMGRVESGWVEPAAVALRAVLAAGELSGRSVLVVGGGPIGQLCCRLARHYGAARVWLSEPSPERRGYAEASQADRAFDPTLEAADVERLRVDVVLECSGSEPGIRSSVAAVRPEGTVVVVGGGRAGLDPIAILIKELRVLGSFTYADEFAEVIALLADGALQVADLTSEIVRIDDAPAAFERLRDASTMKILIAPTGP